jgi:hypothetical protein
MKRQGINQSIRKILDDPKIARAVFYHEGNVYVGLGFVRSYHNKYPREALEVAEKLSSFPENKRKSLDLCEQFQKVAKIKEIILKREKLKSKPPKLPYFSNRELALINPTAIEKYNGISYNFDFDDIAKVIEGR